MVRGGQAKAKQSALCALVAALSLLTLPAGLTAQNTSTSPPGTFRLPPGGRAPDVQGPSNEGIPPLTRDDLEEDAPPPRTTAPAPTTSAATGPATQPSGTAATAPRSATTSGAAGSVRRPATSGAPPAANAVPPVGASQLAPPTAAADPGFTDPLIVTPPAGSDSADETAAVDSPPSTASAGPPPFFAGTMLYAAMAAVLLAVAGFLWLMLRGGGGRSRVALAGDMGEPSAPPPPTAPNAPAPSAPAPKPAPRAPAITPRAPDAAPTTPRAAPSGLVTLPVSAVLPRPRVTMMLQLEKLEVGADAFNVGFRLHLTNNGDVPAVGGLVRVALMQARSGQESAIGLFFVGTGGSVLADGADIAPGQTIHVDAEAQLPLAAVTPLKAGARDLLVPVLALDASYHWDGAGDGFGQVAAAYVLGQEPAGSEGNPDARLGPIPLGEPRFIARPGARATGLQQSV